MNKKERGELMNKRALELARFGEHEDYVTIEIALRGEGFSEARQWLANRFLRKEINEKCRQARASKSGK